MRIVALGFLLIGIFFQSCEAAAAQKPDPMSQLLNQIDQPAYWQQNVAPSTPTAIPPSNNPTGNGPRENPFTLKNILKNVWGGSSNTSPTDIERALAAAREDLQTARDQESQARDASNQIAGESDKGTKQSLAEQAGYHASAAREAADRAYGTSCNFNSSEISDMASEARSLANEAQVAADRARANAAGSGW